MALYCPDHQPWNQWAVATIPVTCPSCIIESLRAENAELLKDKERLDWFSERHGRIYEGECIHDIVCEGGNLLRTQMDKEMAIAAAKGEG